MTSIVPSAVRIDVVKPIAITTAIATSPRIMLFFFSLYRFYDLDLLRFAFLLPTAICLGNNPNNSAYTSISVLFVRDCPPKPALRILRIHHMPIPMRFFTFFATIGFRCRFQKIIRRNVEQCTQFAYRCKIGFCLRVFPFRYSLRTYVKLLS